VIDTGRPRTARGLSEGGARRTGSARSPRRGRAAAGEPVSLDP
jgi:hypothetical protein